jgi:hypothetical protein
MSDSETPTTPPASEASPAQSTDSAASTSPPAVNLDELRRKLREQFSGLGEQVDALQSKLAADLAQATAQARAAIEKEIATVKDQYPDALNRLHELRDVGEEGWGVLRTRLDRLAGDLEKALGGFVTALGDAVKTQSGGSSPPPAASDASPAADSPAPTSQDAPPDGGTSDKPSS